MIGNKATGSINVKNLYPDLYNKFTISNFIIVPQDAESRNEDSTGSFAQWRSVTQRYRHTNKFTKSYNSSTGVLSFDLSLYHRVTCDEQTAGLGTNADASTTLHCPCNVYLFHSEIKSKKLYEIGTYGYTSTVDLSKIDGYKNIWTSDIIVALESCDNTGYSEYNNPGQADNGGTRTIVARAIASYQLASSYSSAGKFTFTVTMSGASGNEKNNFTTKIYVIQ